MARIRINKDGLSSNISTMQEHVVQLETLNGSLSSLIDDINASWEGDSCIAYIDTMKKRLSKSEQLIKVLETFIKYMEAARNRFEEKDKSGARRIFNSDYDGGGGGSW